MTETIEFLEWAYSNNFIKDILDLIGIEDINNLEDIAIKLEKTIQELENL